MSSVYLPRRKRLVQALAYPRQINLVGRKRCQGGPVLMKMAKIGCFSRSTT